MLPSFQRLFQDLLRLLIYILGSTPILVCYLMRLHQITCPLALDYARGWKNGNGCGKNNEYKDLFPKGKDSTQTQAINAFLCILLYMSQILIRCFKT